MIVRRVVDEGLRVEEAAHAAGVSVHRFLQQVGAELRFGTAPEPGAGLVLLKHGEIWLSLKRDTSSWPRPNSR